VERRRLAASIHATDASEPTLQVWVLDDGGGPPQDVTVQLAGEACTDTTDAAYRAVRELLADGSRHLTLDLQDVTFLDARGATMLIALQGLCEERGGTVRLLAPSRPARLVLHLTQLDRSFTIVDGPARRPDLSPAATERS
jgi:anti-sigma B factor antagonist